jgi:Polyketide cyclase / dehydrase and lipid transport
MGKPYVVERRVTTSAPVERVHGLVADFHEWTRWSPWEGLDPDLRRTYSGPDVGVGARYAWEGNRKAGAGTMVVTGDTPQRVDVDLAFTRPFPSTSRVELLLEPAGEGTTVVWRLVGELKGPARVLALVKSMDSLLGPDLEKGLTRLQQVAEQD